MEPEILFQKNFSESIIREGLYALLIFINQNKTKMIIVSGKELNLLLPVDQMNDNEKWVTDEIAKLGDKKFIKLTYFRGLSKEEIAAKPTVGFDVSSPRVNPKSHVREHWVFSDAVQPMISKDGLVKQWPKKHVTIPKTKETYLYPESDSELIFFLLNIVDVENYGFIVENREEIARKRNSVRKVVADVENWVLNRLTEPEIKKICLRYGIVIEEKTTEELRDELLEVIKTKEAEEDKIKGYEGFIKEMNLDSDIMRIAAYFNQAVQEKKISFNPQNRTCFWTTTNETMGGVIPPVRFAHDKEEYMVEHLMANPEEKEFFLASINGSMDKLAFSINDFESIGNRATLRKWGIDNLGKDISLKGTVDEGKAMLRQFIEDSKKITVE
jgi:hypothetical protein